MIKMVEIRKDKKSDTWAITKTDNEGFSRQVNFTTDEMDDLINDWKMIKSIISE